MYLLPLFTQPNTADSDHLIVISLKRVHSTCDMSNSHMIFFIYISLSLHPYHQLALTLMWLPINIKRNLYTHVLLLYLL